MSSSAAASPFMGVSAMAGWCASGKHLEEEARKKKKCGEMRRFGAGSVRKGPAGEGGRCDAARPDWPRWRALPPTGSPPDGIGGRTGPSPRVPLCVRDGSGWGAAGVRLATTKKKKPAAEASARPPTSLSLSPPSPPPTRQFTCNRRACGRACARSGWPAGAGGREWGVAQARLRGRGRAGRAERVTPLCLRLRSLALARSQFHTAPCFFLSFACAPLPPFPRSCSTPSAPRPPGWASARRPSDPPAAP